MTMLFFFFSILCRAAFIFLFFIYYVIFTQEYPRSLTLHIRTLEVRPESKLGIVYDHNVKGMILNYYDMT